MKRLSINLLTNVLLLLVGIALIVFYSLTDVLWWVAMVMGALFAVPSLVYLFKVSFSHADTRASNDYMGVVPAVGGLCFGLVMLIKAHLFAGVITLLMGVLLVVLGMFHVLYLLLSKRVINVSGWYFLAPLVVIGTGAAVLFSPELREQGGKVAMLTGLGLLLFNFTSLQEYFAERRKRKADAAEQALPDQPASPADTTEPHYEL
ncbi:MAG: DUF308 domain-containing protein [Muribaculaceae bacterium]|nr:DUF308 domain-containing protein [Muribaculaceae bacterium]